MWAGSAGAASARCACDPTAAPTPSAARSAAPTASAPKRRRWVTVIADLLPLHEVAAWYLHNLIQTCVTRRASTAWPSGNSYHWQAMTTGSRLTARPLGPDEIAFAVHAVGAVQPRHPWSEEELGLHWDTMDRMGRRRTLVLEEAGRPAGWVEATMWDESPEKASRVLVYVPDAGPDPLDQAWAIVEEAAGDLGAR